MGLQPTGLTRGESRGRIADRLVPASDWKLSGDNGRAAGSMRSCSSTIRRRVRAFGAAIGAGEEVVFVTGLDRPDGALDGIDQFKHVGTPKTLGRLRVRRRLAELSGKQHDTETPTHRPPEIPGGRRPGWSYRNQRRPRRAGGKHAPAAHRQDRTRCPTWELLLDRSVRSASGSTADYGPSAVSPAIGTLYASDTSLQPDGSARVLGYTRARSATAA